MRLWVEDRGVVTKRINVPESSRKWEDSESDKYDTAFTNKVCQFAHARGH